MKRFLHILCRAEEYKLVEGEISLIEDAKKFLSHCAADANDSNFHFIVFLCLMSNVFFALRYTLFCVIVKALQKYKEKLHIMKRCCAFFVILPKYDV